MTDDDPARLRLLATFIAGRSVDVARATAGDVAYTDGSVVFVSPGSDTDRQRREVLVQSALLGAGSLKPSINKALRARPSITRRYLAIEGQRVLTDLADRVPAAVDIALDAPRTSTPEESLRVARGRQAIPDPPDWFGAVKPSRLTVALGTAGGATPDIEAGQGHDDGEEAAAAEKSTILKLFETPISMSETMSNLFRKLLGTGRSTGEDDAGGALRVGSIRHAHGASSDARLQPTPIRFTSDTPGATVGVGGAWFPEWDVHGDRYRPEWCRVVDFPLPSPDTPPVELPRDDALARRLARIGLGPRVLRRRPDGDELDIEALVDVVVDLNSGFSPPEHVYAERRDLDRNLGVLVLLDASGSATDADPRGLAVHEHQRRAAATVVGTLEELGDRVALYAFRSRGRHDVQLPAVKTFEQRFDAAARTRLNGLQPSGYTRLGAGIRGAGEILKEQAGTPHRLLLVFSDGFPYDHGYEGRYAEADSAKALHELRADGVACLCLSLGAAPEADALARVFGEVCHATAGTLADLSPRMDELFRTALAELSAPAARDSTGRWRCAVAERRL